VLLLFIVSACSQEKTYEPLAPGATVLAFGDSVTHGTGANPGEDYPAVLARSTGWKVINAGVPGELARDAKHRIGPLLVEHRPELVIIELGGNDFLRKRRDDLVKQDLHSIIRSSQDAGAIAVLVAVPRLSLLRAGVGALKDSGIFEQLAEETGVLLIDSVFSDVLSEDALRADQVHPNAEGYRVLTAGFVDALRGAGLVR
jgi:acyl-CoA hydrolase